MGASENIVLLMVEIPSLQTMINLLYKKYAALRMNKFLTAISRHLQI